MLCITFIGVTLQDMVIKTTNTYRLSKYFIFPINNVSDVSRI